ncbi:ATP-binding protein [Maricaulis maris]|uniref:histidine kinase n=1 Tax=Maricaulis maris TaxID=74318 RepID=A0A495DDD5_9PROT|nr:ATP-binding protein [Maricaulis maris]RKR00273.1 signal transduction histidine kinase [Maricaulis maris]
MTIWAPIDRLIGCNGSDDLKATLRARIALVFAAMLTLISLANASLLALSDQARPGMALLGLASAATVAVSGLAGIWLRRPSITMTFIAVSVALVYAAAIYGNRGGVPPAFAYLPCILLGFYQFWGPRSLYVALPGVGAAFLGVFALADIVDAPPEYPVVPLSVALMLACIWLISLAAVFRSVQKLAESQLRLANADQAAALSSSRAAQRAKSEFLANVGHEVRTPLNGMLGMADVMRHVGGLSPEQDDRLRLIRESGATLLELLNEILDQSKIETGQVIAETVSFDLARLAQKTAESWRPEAEARALDLHLDIAGLQQSVLTGDPLRLRQILNNLISNALKFTEAGHVTLRVSQAADANLDRWETRLDVIDTGTGIPPEKHETIFEAFNQADASITRRYGGTGLGLSISRQLARLMGGDLTVRSSDGGGSCFSLTLSLTAGQAETPATPAPVERPELDLSRPVRILSVDDVATNHIVLRALLEQVLAGASLSIEKADSGPAAIEAARGNEFDLIFMDIQMPEMDGVTAARHIRQGENGHSAWLVALSALEAAQSERLLPPGLFQTTLPKPTSIATLQSVLADWQMSRDLAPADSQAGSPSG